MNDAASWPRRRRRLLLPLVLAGAVVVVIAIWAAHTSILRESAALWVVNDKLEPADAIAVLGRGEQLPRLLVAASLYKKGLADKILVANVKPGPLEELGIVRPYADWARHILLARGVPEGAVVGFGADVSSTLEESRALADWAKHTGARSIIVPTESFASRRYRWILNHELAPVGARAIIDAHNPLEYNGNDWWRHEEGLIDFENEVVKYLYERLNY